MNAVVHQITVGAGTDWIEDAAQKLLRLNRRILSGIFDLGNRQEL